MQFTKLFALFLLGCLAYTVSAHCEIPCGIFDDAARIQALEEDFTTIEKAIHQINELSKNPTANMNQLVRWVQAKEHHADHVREVVTQYFMAQRIKPAKEGDVAGHQAYIHKLSLLHQMLISAMKTKQTTDASHVETLRKLLKEFSVAYFGGESKAYYAQEAHPHQHQHPHPEGFQHQVEVTNENLIGKWELTSVEGTPCARSEQKAVWEFSANRLQIKVQDQFFQGSYSVVSQGVTPIQLALQWENSSKSRPAILQITSDTLTLKIAKEKEEFATHFEQEEGYELLTFKRN